MHLFEFVEYWDKRTLNIDDFKREMNFFVVWNYFFVSSRHILQSVSCEGLKSTKIMSFHLEKAEQRESLLFI